MINAKDVDVGYEEKLIIKNLSVRVKKGEIVSIIGPNGSGKSTLLKALVRLLKIRAGDIKIMDKPISSLAEKEISKILTIVSQHNTSPNDITVKDLVYYGRIPHKKWYETRNKEDEEIVNWALENTGITHYKDRIVHRLSGGERQRVWIAMALAQKPKILFLDEPTTYLDMCHQLELMELVKEINKKLDITVVMVLHDLNQASRYSDRIIVMKEGKIVAEGTPKDTINEKILKDVYKVQCRIDEDPITSRPQIFPLKVSYK